MILQTTYPAVYPGWTPRRGFGDAASEAAQATQLGGSLASSTIGAISAAGVATTIPSLTIPLIGVGVAAVTIAIALIKNSGCGDTCIIASNDANKIEPLLLQNLNGYMNGPRTVASQQQALQNFDEIWAALVQACSNPALGNAGKRCISDRQAGACHYGTSPNCWNWFVGYRDPIQNDPNVVASQPLDAITGGQSLSDAIASVASSSGLFGFSWSQLFIPALLLAVLWVMS